MSTMPPDESDLDEVLDMFAFFESVKRSLLDTYADNPDRREKLRKAYMQYLAKTGMYKLPESVDDEAVQAAWDGGYINGINNAFENLRMIYSEWLDTDTDELH